MTPVRRYMLELFGKSDQPLSAREIFDKISKTRLACNRTTVYRELEMLTKEKVLRAVDFGDGVKRFEHSGGAHHHHFICSKCKTVFDVNLKNDLDTEERLLEKIHGVQIDSHSLEFFGRCKKCK